MTIIEENFGSSFSCHDLTGNGFVDLNDLWPFLLIGMPYNHTGHGCHNYIGVESSSGGAIKSMYQ